MFATAISTTIGLVAGNFIYQAAMSHDWGTAIERSIFQVGAVAVVVYLIQRDQKRHAR